jgi:DNA polymerase I-like protein with 3'-5' exonuclease and polymerase domains
LSIELKQQGMDKFFFDHVMAIQPHLVKMCVLGIDMDMGLKEYITVQLQQDVRDLVSKFHQTVAEATGEADYQPNPKSNKQMAELYFDKLRLVGRGTSTDAENRKRMLAHPRTLEPAKAVLRAVDEFAKEQKFLATYAEMRVDPDGRGRSEYKQYGTQNAPGRLSSTGTLWGSGANFQNQPERAKPMFLADKNCRFVYFDLSQAEARIVAEIWNVTALKANFALAAGQGVDVHRANAATIFKCSIDDIPKEDRFPDGTVTKRFLGKRCVHGLNYRMQIQKLADVCGIPYAQAEQAWWAYHRAFPEIQQGWEETISEVYRDKVLYTPLGRRMIFLGRLPSRNAAHGSEEASQLDSIIAFKPQATVGDHVAKCIANIECDPEWPILEARVVLNIHDALIAQTPDSDDIALHCAKVMKRHAEAPIMIRGNPLVIPADFAMSQAVAWRVTNEGRNDEKLEFYEANDNGRHRWSSLKKLKLVA